MIGSLRGVLLDRTFGEVLVEVGGVGYRVTVTPTTSIRMGELGAAVFVHIHHHVREDAVTLYGFAAKDERQCFEALIGAHGVGPSLALAILSVHSPSELRVALASDDVAALCLVPGVGKKTATRLLIELKSKLDLPDVVDLTVIADATGGARSGSIGGERPGTVLADVRDALAGLGYDHDEIRDVMARLPVADDAQAADAGELVRRALKLLAVRA
jgi:Holliday junction DNA helicase RuvA